MKFRLKHFTLEHYIHYVRRQSKHVQHIHAFVFAGTITAIIAGFILYTDYGFWHETYRASDASFVTDMETVNEFNPESPMESLSRFLGEAKSRLGSIEFSNGSLLEGKETFTR